MTAPSLSSRYRDPFHPLPSILSRRFQKMRIPGAISESENQYFCTMLPLPSGEEFLTDVSPVADSSAAHHITLFGCEYSSIETEPDPLE